MTRVVPILAAVLVAGAAVLVHEPSKAFVSSSLALEGVEVALPPLNVRHFTSSGFYLQVSNPNVSLTKTNEALRASALGYERAYAAWAKSEEAGYDGSLPKEPGRYLVVLSPQLISANSVVVSELIPVVEDFPGAAANEVWQSITVQVGSGSPIMSFSQLFNNPHRALDIIATRTYYGVLHGHSPSDLCAQNNQRGVPGPTVPIGGFSPRAANYRYFALTRAGIAIGIPQGAVASDDCGRLEANIPFSILRPYLNALGRSLTSGVQSPISLR